MTTATTVPTPRILLGVRNKRWTIAEALAELIDNSFGESRGNAANVWIDIDRRRRVITLIDDGQGVEDISALFTLGKGTREGGSDIGRYGMGGSEALLWLADRATVGTLRRGMACRAVVSWTECITREEFPEIDTSWHVPTAAIVPIQLLALGTGTAITIELHKGLRLPNDGNQRSALRSPVSRLFAPGLRAGRRIIWNGEELEPYSLGLGDDALRFAVSVEATDGQRLNADVTAGACSASLENSKVAVCFGYRVIEETRDPFGDYQGAGIAGWLSLSEEWREYLTTTKDGFADSNLRAVLMAQVAERLSPLLDELRRQRASSIFAQIAVKLEASLGGMFKVDVDGKQDQTRDTVTAEPQGKDGESATEDLEDGPTDKPVHRGSGATEIEIQHGTDSELDGRLVDVFVIPGRPIVATVNAEHRLIVEALQRQPINQLLLVSFIVHELSKELVKTPALLTRTRLFTANQLDELIAVAGSDGIDLLPYVNRRLLDRVAA